MDVSSVKAMLNRVLISSRIDRKDAIELVEDVVSYVFRISKVKEVIIDETLKNRIHLRNEKIRYISVKDFEKYRSDMLIVIGGDGTLLRVLHYFHKTPPSVLGIRLGRYGFLMEIESSMVFDALKKIVEGRIQVITKPRIVMHVKDKYLSPVLNDYVILAPRLKVVRLKVLKKSTGETILNVLADGLIISPTAGSTAYSLSAGGPIIDEDLKVVIVTPLNPMQLRARSIVLDIKEELDVEVLDKDVEVYSDGMFCCNIEKNSKISIKFWDEVYFYRLKQGYYDRLKRRDYV